MHYWIIYFATDISNSLQLSDDIIRMPDNGLLKTLLFAMAESDCRRGKPSREWLEDIRKCVMR